MTSPLPPSQNIGPYYKVIGLIVVLGTFGVVVLGILKGFSAWVILGLAIAFIMALIVVVRPERFDEAFKTLIAKIPFTKYSGPPPGGAGS